MSKENFTKHPGYKFFKQELNPNINPEKITIRSGLILNFECPECKHNFTQSPHGLKSCKFCKKQALCDNIDCTICFNKTLASYYFKNINDYKIYNNYTINNDYISATRLINEQKFKHIYDNILNIIPLNKIFRGTRKEYYFICSNCKHSDLMNVVHVTNNAIKDCGYCSPKNAKRLCSKEKECTLCFQKSFASHPKSTCWDYSEGKNEGKTPYDVSISGTYIADFICDICEHSFKSKCNSVSSGFWCPYCAGQKRCENIECNLCTSRKLSSHPMCNYLNKELNNNIVPSNISLGNSRLPLWFNCPNNSNHPPHQKTPANIARGQGCSKCNGGVLHTFDEFIENANKVHNNKYKYHLVDYKNSQTKVLIQCPKEHIFLQAPYHHLNETGCPICAKSSYSKIAITWLKYISISNDINIQHAETLHGEFKIPNSRYKADGYCKENNTIYEFHGDFYHGNPNIYKHDFINKLVGKTMGELYTNTQCKKQHIIMEGFNYIEIWESDWHKAIKYVKKIQRKWRLSKIRII